MSKSAYAWLQVEIQIFVHMVFFTSPTVLLASREKRPQGERPWRRPLGRCSKGYDQEGRFVMQRRRLEGYAGRKEKADCFSVTLSPSKFVSVLATLRWLAKKTPSVIWRGKWKMIICSGILRFGYGGRHIAINASRSARCPLLFRLKSMKVWLHRQTF